jgi:hypothetical protein
MPNINFSKIIRRIPNRRPFRPLSRSDLGIKADPLYSLRTNVNYTASTHNIDKIDHVVSTYIQNHIGY